MKTVMHLFSIVGLTLLLAACYESADVTLHEAGEYKGESDSLMKADAETRAETLEERFNLVQTDR